VESCELHSKEHPKLGWHASNTRGAAHVAVHEVGDAESGERLRLPTIRFLKGAYSCN
jgi:hypothetical protein